MLINYNIYYTRLVDNYLGTDGVGVEAYLEFRMLISRCLMATAQRLLVKERMESILLCHSLTLVLNFH